MSTHFSLPIDDVQPQVPPEAFIAPTASILGRVQLGAHANIWYAAVLRGDTEQITIGEATNIQDGCVVHADPGYPATVGGAVTVGHRAVVHGCTIEDNCLIGMGVVVMNGARIGTGSLVAAGAVVLENTEIPPGSLVAGTPAKVKRQLSDDEQAMIKLSAEQYVQLAAKHRQALER